MLITDGVTDSYDDIFEKLNSLQNGTVKPIRIFTYLIGLEVENVEDIKKMACNNRGNKILYCLYNMFHY